VTRVGRSKRALGGYGTGVDGSSSLRERVAGCVGPVVGGVAIIGFAILASFPLAFVVGFLGEDSGLGPYLAQAGFAVFWLGTVFGGSLLATRAVARSFLVHPTDRARRLTIAFASVAVTAALTLAMLAWTRWIFR
jgi:hypothetical protein